MTVDMWEHELVVLKVSRMAQKRVVQKAMQTAVSKVVMKAE